MTNILRTAVISACERYRYSLVRTWDEGNGTVVFVGCNPSKADAHVDDPTVRKMIGFARRWGFRRMMLVNLFAWRATDVRELAKHALVIGESNPRYIDAAFAQADRVVLCWGAESKMPKSLRAYARACMISMPARHREVYVFGYTVDGHAPLHPLYLPYDQPLQRAKELP